MKKNLDNPLKNIKTILSSQTVRGQPYGHTLPTLCSLGSAWWRLGPHVCPI